MPVLNAACCSDLRVDRCHPRIAAAFFAVAYEREQSGPAAIWALAPMLLNRGVILPLSDVKLRPYLDLHAPIDSQAEDVFAAVPSEIDLRMMLQRGAYVRGLPGLGRARFKR